MEDYSSNRLEMVEAARKFMLTPKVRDSPPEEQKLFLLSKGLTEAEISEARSLVKQDTRVGAVNVVEHERREKANHRTNKLVSFAQSVSIFGCVSYVAYRFVRSFILPHFIDISDPATAEVRQLQVQVNELQNSIKFVLDSISQTTSMLINQQQEINRALLVVGKRDADISNVEAGISAIKSLLLSQNSFAPILVPTSRTAELPSWQQAEAPLFPIPNSGYSTPSASHIESKGECMDNEAAMSGNF
ncbi:peroxisomal membrane anchor protein region [Dictyocaulus viviparus]|uniref:Peroxisomal membrane protein PEX14 n=1 Tax=Dictyocaulus viviparus TaxID=29172 RepID=A0A0D8Y692_DICVI|nr:peroxisomal membrane anchor protein region [Dictyocaulus viviparus]